MVKVSTQYPSDYAEATTDKVPGTQEEKQCGVRGSVESECVRSFARTHARSTHTRYTPESAWSEVTTNLCVIRWVFILAVVIAVLPATLHADSGVYGRAAWRGELVPGVVISAYKDGKGSYLADPVAVSEPAATDGTYRLALPPGQYTVVARSFTDPQRRPGPEDYYCYYSGSPVIVSADSWTPVGFNLVKTGNEKRTLDGKTSIEGLITYRDEPLGKLYLYIYDKAMDGFRGPGIATIPVGEGGRFRVSVKPGEYFLIARKRNKGGMYGPMEIGDHFNYYPQNPVIIGERETVAVSLETVTRVSQLEEGEAPMPTVMGKVVDTDGNPVSGLRVFVYRPGEVTGRPLYFSGSSGAQGQFSLVVPLMGDFTLVAKRQFGGPAGAGELSGQLDKLHLPLETGSDPVTIVVQEGKQL